MICVEKSVLDSALSIFKAAKTVVWMTGAGMSAESGIPTFRDAQSGLWARFDPQQLASAEGYRADPASVWSWYQWRRRLVVKAKPHAGHFALAEFQKAFGHGLITQNVDGLHQLAGASEVIELHGNIRSSSCFAQRHPLSVPMPDINDVADAELLESPPHCPLCGSTARPDVVWFGESLPMDALQHAEALSYGCDVFVSVGTSSQVYPAAGFALLAKSQGAKIIEINPVATPLSEQNDCAIRGQASEVLPLIAKRLLLN